MKSNTHAAVDLAEATRLLVGTLPYSAGSDDIAEAFGAIASVHDVYLSQPKSANQQNGGWAIIAVDKAAADDMLNRTILVGSRVARVKRARPNSQ